MVIEEHIIIHAPLRKVWETFTDMSCWNDWNKVFTIVSTGGTKIMTAGSTFRFCWSPFNFPFSIASVIEEVIPQEKVVWRGEKYGISARHAFIFEQREDRVRVTSRETFAGVPVKTLGFLFPEQRLRKLTVSLLGNLKGASET